MKWSVDDKKIATLTLNDSPCNEIGLKSLEGLETFFKEIDTKNLRALVIHSEMVGGFCAGADLRQLHDKRKTMTAQQQTKEIRKFLDRIHDVFDRLDALACPTIGVIHGVCFGGGFELALTCDILIAEESARFCFPELRLGLIPGFGGIPRLRRDIGNAAVRDLLLTGRSFNANKALSLGLVSQVVPDKRGLSIAMRMAEQTSKFDSQVVSHAKKFMKPIPKKELAKEKEIFIKLFKSDRVQEALRRFVESESIQPYLP